jgi:O-methyltransferase domain/Dimerisation domain
MNSAILGKFRQRNELGSITLDFGVRRLVAAFSWVTISACGKARRQVSALQSSHASSGHKLQTQIDYSRMPHILISNQNFAGGLMSAAPEHDKEQPPAHAILQIILGFWMSRAVYVLAKLGIPDLIKDGAKTAEEIAAITNMHGPSLYRILRALVSVGVLRSEKGGRFGLTPLSEMLTTDAPGSLRWFVVSELGQEHYPAWGNLMHSVKTGEIAFDSLYGMNVWQYFEKNPDDAAVFNDSMRMTSAAVNEAITSLYDFSNFNTLVDVGGGHGGLITGILKNNPHLRGILFDAPEVIKGAREKVDAAGVGDRCETVSGNFFESVPSGGDAYIMKWIIHDWDDDRSIRILENCRKHMSLDSRLILVDCVVPEDDAPDFSKLFDLNMLVMTGGMERTEAEFRDLLQAAGFRLLRVIPTDLPPSIIEAEPV